MVTGKDFRMCLVCYPFLPRKDTGRGMDRYSYELLKYLGLHGISPSVLHRGKFHHLSDWMINELTFPLEMGQVDAELYHAVSPVGARSAVLARKFPLITTIPDVIPFYFRSHAPLRYAYDRFCWKLSAKSDKIIAISRFTKEALVSLLGMSSEKIKVIYLGVDQNAYYPLKKDADGKKRVLFVGGGLRGMTSAKGVGTLMKAFFMVQKRLKDVELLVGGRNTEQFKELVHAFKIQSKVNFLGFIPEEELPFYYNLADAFVFPSHYGFGLMLLEAMACGTPVIASNALDAPEYVGEAGILVRPDDVGQLTNALLKILTDEKLKDALSGKAIQRAKAFSWRKMAKETADVYKEVLHTTI